MTLKTKILAIDFEVAQNIITNDDLAKVVDTSDDWIFSRTGIKERRILSNSETSTDLGVNVAKKIIKRANFNPEKIDLILVSSSSPEEIYPSISNRIQAEINAINAVCFDLKAACSGFVYALQTAQAFIKSNTYKNILIIATDASSKFTNWQDRTTCVLFGDGAGGALVCANDNEENIIKINLSSDGTLGDLITLNTFGENIPLLKENQNKSKACIKMNGKDVYKFVMTKVPDEVEKILKKANLKKEDIDYFIPHQSNQRMTEALAQRLGFEEEKVISNIKYYGNMSAASIPAAIREGVDKGKIKLPATVLLVAFGAGMCTGCAIIKLNRKI